MITCNNTIDGKPNLILDIDETIIKSNIYRLDYIESIKSIEKTQRDLIISNSPDLKNIIEIDNNIIYDKLYLTTYNDGYYIYIITKRPYLKEFIIKMHSFFNIHIYSLGMNKYINKIVEEISKIIGFNPFCKIIANTNICNRFMNKRICNLSIGLSNLLIIDDRDDVWNFDKHNLYKIQPYQINKIDIELYKIIRIIDIYYNKFSKTTFDIYKFRKILYEIQYKYI